MNSYILLMRHANEGPVSEEAVSTGTVTVWEPVVTVRVPTTLPAASSLTSTGNLVKDTCALYLSPGHPNKVTG